VPLIPNVNQNVAMRTSLSVFEMDVFIILSATSDYNPHPVLKIVCCNFQNSFFRRIHGESGNRCGNVWCCVVTAEIFLVNINDNNYDKPLLKCI
jgi:hypothetical protein